MRQHSNGRWMRLKTLMAANLNALVEQAENPEKILRLLIRQMEEASQALRKDITAATKQERSLAEQLQASDDEHTSRQLRLELEQLDSELRTLCQHQLQLEDRLEDGRQKLAGLNDTKATAFAEIKQPVSRLDRKLARSDARRQRFNAQLDDLEARVEAYDLSQRPGASVSAEVKA